MGSDAASLRPARPRPQRYSVPDRASEEAVALCAVVLPLQRLEVRELVAPAVRDRLDVVDLPAVLRGRVAMLRVSDWRAAQVAAPFVRVESLDGVLLRNTRAIVAGSNWAPVILVP